MGFPSFNFSSPRPISEFPEESLGEDTPARKEILERYRPRFKLGTGGFGTVVVCQGRKLHNNVVVKRIPLTDSAGNPTPYSDHALKEAFAVSLLNSSNIPAILDLAYDSSNAYMVFEYVDGCNLKEVMERLETMRAEASGDKQREESVTRTILNIACALVQDLGRAITHAHENGVLHLDIKPTNILIDHSGVCYLADFGMAVLASSVGYQGALGGTVGYMPPEQLQGEHVDERTDLFALAVVIYQLICGVSPFPGPSPLASLEQIESPDRLLPTLDFGIDMPYEALCPLMFAMSPNPDDRQPSVAKFRDDFLAAMSAQNEDKRVFGKDTEGASALKSIVGDITSDSPADPEPEPEPKPKPEPIPIDPEQGRVGTRVANGRRLSLGIASAIVAVISTFSLLGRVGATLAGRAVAGIGIGCASFLAPQVGSAVVGAGLVYLAFHRTPFLSALPTAILLAATTFAWWAIWGRMRRRSSTVLMFAFAIAPLSMNVWVLGPLVAALAAYTLPPEDSAATTGTSLALASLGNTLIDGSGPFLALDLVRSVLNPGFLGGAVLYALLAAMGSYLLRAAWDNHSEQGERKAYLICAAPFFMGGALLCALANRMEISAHPVEAAVSSLLVAGLSTILIFVCMYLFGFNKDPEGDLS